MRITREHAAVAGTASPCDQIWDNRWRMSGPCTADLQIRALGHGITQCSSWRDTGLPHSSLRASPAIWRGADLIAAPLAGFGADWSAELIKSRDDFAAFLIRR